MDDRRLMEEYLSLELTEQDLLVQLQYFKSMKEALVRMTSEMDSQVMKLTDK